MLSNCLFLYFFGWILKKQNWLQINQGNSSLTSTQHCATLNVYTTTLTNAKFFLNPLSVCPGYCSRGDHWPQCGRAVSHDVFISIPQSQTEARSASQTQTQPKESPCIRSRWDVYQSVLLCCCLYRNAQRYLQNTEISLSNHTNMDRCHSRLSGFCNSHKSCLMC